MADPGLSAEIRAAVAASVSDTAMPTKREAPGTAARSGRDGEFVADEHTGWAPRRWAVAAEISAAIRALDERRAEPQP